MYNMYMNEKDINKDHLNELQRKVTQQCGTEPAFSGEYLDHKEDGTYTCVVCDTPLFRSDTKYESGTGWPSFSDAIEENIETKIDTSGGMERTEVVCKNCGAHLGHVFDDGPTSEDADVPATGKRYCINSAAMDFASGG